MAKTGQHPEKAACVLDSLCDEYLVFCDLPASVFLLWEIAPWFFGMVYIILVVCGPSRCCQGPALSPGPVLRVTCSLGEWFSDTSDCLLPASGSLCLISFSGFRYVLGQGIE